MTQQIVISDYTFDYVAKTITFTSLPKNFDIRGVQLITNLATDALIYQFNSPTLGGTAVGNVLTLTSSSAVGASNNDQLQILYNPPTGGFFDRMTWLLSNMLDHLRSPAWLQLYATGPKLAVATDANSVIGTVNALTTVTTVATVTTVTTCTTVAGVTNITNFGNINAAEIHYAEWQNLYLAGQRRLIATN